MAGAPSSETGQASARPAGWTEEEERWTEVPAYLHVPILFRWCQSVINPSVSVSPKVPKDEGASGADGDQETCQQDDLCRGRFRI